MRDGICMICREKNRSDILMHLRRIDQMLHGIPEDTESARGLAFLWDIHSRCPYGMSCPTLEENKRNCMRIARDLESRIVAVAVGNNDSLYYETLRMMQGYFPAVYRTMERLRAQKKEEKNGQDD